MPVIPNYNTPLFTNIYETVDLFLEDYNNIGIPTTISAENARTLFYLLYAYYGNNPIANLSIDQFKMKLFAIIFQYAPTWAKRLEIQNNLRSLSDEELMRGAKTVYNHASHPGTDPSTSSLEELQYIDDQNTASIKKNVVDAYRNLWEMLRVDVTKILLDQFRVLFKSFVTPTRTILFESED